ncbi:hypothetical protein AVEN_161038-1 [Araneus ventricosus]|uniref:Uncharacterized protein n=1 Tax=Araneus ventricosus TaxID=182803 RepID=A0A4Y2AW05_ARAVE|nr:hypothetical protein AVEN_223606-1 [Araneus ventricosus]GBL84251.1 hypothetical protein AVEN_76295-1 [Araneus ventricosus]GBL84289.1 hypothetical protein AVEN_112519-1 [Araneus ventricosus]GBL84341.1 hypothetical protein AVEN_161038-1 [Araneus ventricosus]
MCALFHSVFPKRLAFFFPPFKSKNEARCSRRLQSALPPLFDPPTAALPFPLFSTPTLWITDFLASSWGPNLGRSFDVPLASHPGPKLESAHECWILSSLAFQRCQFPSVFKTDDCFFLPVFQKFHFGRDMNACLTKVTQKPNEPDE